MKKLRIITLTVGSSNCILCLCFIQDYCGTDQINGSFRIITENVPCGTTGTTCSKTIKIFLGVNATHLHSTCSASNTRPEYQTDIGVNTVKLD